MMRPMIDEEVHVKADAEPSSPWGTGLESLAAAHEASGCGGGGDSPTTGQLSTLVEPPEATRPNQRRRPTKRDIETTLPSMASLDDDGSTPPPPKKVNKVAKRDGLVHALPRIWSPEEDETLIRAVEESRTQSGKRLLPSWPEVARILGNGRTPEMCRHRYDRKHQRVAKAPGTRVCTRCGVVKKGHTCQALADPGPSSALITPPESAKPVPTELPTAPPSWTAAMPLGRDTLAPRAITPPISSMPLEEDCTDYFNDFAELTEYEDDAAPESSRPFTPTPSMPQGVSAAGRLTPHVHWASPLCLLVTGVSTADEAPVVESRPEPTPTPTAADEEYAEEYAEHYSTLEALGSLAPPSSEAPPTAFASLQELGFDFELPIDEVTEWLQGAA